MKKEFIFYWIIALFAVIFVFSLIVFIWADSYTSNFWVGYFVVITAWAILLSVFVFTVKERKRHKDAVFVNAPLLFFSLLHFVFQTLSGILTMVLPGYSIKLSCTISLLLLIVFCIIAVCLAHYRAKTNSNTAVRKRNRGFIDQFKATLAELELRYADPKVLRLIQDVYETAKYANPDSTLVSVADEDKLFELLNSLKTAITENNILIGPICEEMKILLKKRDR